ncbi:heavy-metal-associated domain-containing protein [Salinithrix halophila]|uniref:Heavy-metal-associated domain-containing protein n=1 Tax=Salinithrix halophila TaxID=1485204 RepID=A0ABV8JEV7_9BACL
MRQAKMMVSGLESKESVQKLLEALEQIGAEGQVDLTTGRVEVVFDEENLTLETISRTIESQGYQVM